MLSRRFAPNDPSNCPRQFSPIGSNLPAYIEKEPAKGRLFFYGGDWLSLFETRPLEDILADIAVGWNDMQRTIGTVRVGVNTEVNYVL